MLHYKQFIHLIENFCGQASQFQKFQVFQRILQILRIYSLKYQCQNERALVVIRIIYFTYNITRFMASRPPYKLTKFVIAYNAFQTAFSLWGFMQGWR